MDYHDRFKQAFKYYKSKQPSPSMADVLTLDLSDKNSEKIQQVSLDNVQCESRCELLGLTDCSRWKTFTFSDHPGLLYIRNPFSVLGQRYWIRRCLEVYPKKPNKTNIDIEIVIEDWWNYCHSNCQDKEKFIKKLRWTTLGYHHDWDTKVYSDNNCSTFPEELAELCDVISRYLGYETFKAQAAIVNYYHMDSTLSPHTDHSEINLEAPLISISFGQSAIFLIGGQDKSVKPSAVQLQSGDIVIMSKEARLCYHAVPKILPAQSIPWNNAFEELRVLGNIGDLKYIGCPGNMQEVFNSNIDNERWEKYNDYVNKSRINLNIRQVLNKTQTCISIR